jgi:Protein of unknown function (DUF5131)
LLGPLDGLDLDGIDWVIAGGESGPGYRPVDPAWVVGIRDRCTEARRMPGPPSGRPRDDFTAWRTAVGMWAHRVADRQSERTADDGTTRLVD